MAWSAVSCCLLHSAARLCKRRWGAPVQKPIKPKSPSKPWSEWRKPDNETRNNLWRASVGPLQSHTPIKKHRGLFYIYIEIPGSLLSSERAPRWPPKDLICSQILRTASVDAAAEARKPNLPRRRCCNYGRSSSEFLPPTRGVKVRNRWDEQNAARDKGAQIQATFTELEKNEVLVPLTGIYLDHVTWTM